jgi:hypothetical protein
VVHYLGLWCTILGCGALSWTLNLGSCHLGLWCTILGCGALSWTLNLGSCHLGLWCTILGCGALSWTLNLGSCDAFRLVAQLLWATPYRDLCRKALEWLHVRISRPLSPFLFLSLILKMTDVACIVIFLSIECGLSACANSGS